jgi:outer membrane protein assembly factor BamE
MKGYRGMGVAILVAVLVAMMGCDLQRDRLMKEKYPSYSESIKRAIEQSYPMHGMDHEQVYLALGEPLCKKTIQHKGNPVEVWLYPPGGKYPCNTAEFRVYFENGTVSDWQTVKVESEGG